MRGFEASAAEHGEAMDDGDNLSENVHEEEEKDDGSGDNEESMEGVRGEEGCEDSDNKENVEGMEEEEEVEDGNRGHVNMWCNDRYLACMEKKQSRYAYLARVVIRILMGTNTIVQIVGTQQLVQCMSPLGSF